MTIAQELTALAEWLYLQSQEMYAKRHEVTGDAFDAKSRQVGALAAKCEGKVLVKPTMWKGAVYGETYASICLPLPKDKPYGTIGASGYDEAEAAVNLQRYIDKEVT